MKTITEIHQPPHATRGGNMDPAVLANFLQRLVNEEMSLDSLLIHANGELQFEYYAWPYRRELPHMLHSATKSFVGTAAGFALHEGHLDLKQPVLDFFPRHALQDPSVHLRRTTVEDLLTMRTGHKTGPSGATWRRLQSSWIDEYFRMPVEHPPGTRFTYSSGTSHILSAVIQTAVGERVSSYLKPRLFEPLQFKNHSWSTDPEGFDSGGNGLSIRSEDLLKWGLLHLNDGKWGTEQVLPSGWTAQATYPHTVDATTHWNGTSFVPAPSTPNETRIREGYGYQTWRGPNGSYFASGMFGQMCLVLPKHNAVIATTAGIGGGRSNRLLEEIITHLVPALEPQDPAAANRQFGHSLLDAQTRAATAAPQLTSTIQVSEPHANYTCDSNADGIESISLRPACLDGGRVLDVRFSDERGDHSVLCGLDWWNEAETTATGWQLHHSYQPDTTRVVAGATWISPTVLVLHWYFNETPFHDTIRITWEDSGDIRWERSTNANSGATSRPPIIGHVMQ